MHPVFVFLIAGVVAVAAWRDGGIVGSKHDFSDQTWSHGQICQPCHHPHTPSGDVPLWAPSDELPQALPLYESPDRRLNSGDVMCLSCHRAHASSAPHAGRWDFNVALLSEDGAVSQSYAIPDPYGGPNQGTLCSKCHEGGAPPEDPAATRSLSGRTKSRTRIRELERHVPR